MAVRIPCRESAGGRVIRGATGGMGTSAEGGRAREGAGGRGEGARRGCDPRRIS